MSIDPTKEEILEQFNKLNKAQQQKVIYGYLLSCITPLYEKKWVEKKSESFWFYYLAFLALGIPKGIGEYNTLGTEQAHFLAQTLAIAHRIDFLNDHDLERIFRFDFALNRVLELAQNLVLDNDHDFVIDLGLALRSCTPDLTLLQDYISSVNDSKRFQKMIEKSFIPPFFAPFNKILTGKVNKENAIIFFRHFYDVLENAKHSYKITALLEWLRSIEEKKTSLQNRARVILLGNGGAGKSSLLRRYLEPKSQLKEMDATPRIEIRQSEVEDVVCDFWDFGGQVIMHSTHHFFINREAVFVVVCNARADEEPDYWLEKLMHRLEAGREFVKKVKVLVIYTFVDDKKERENFEKYRRNALQNRYGAFFALEFFALTNKENDKNFDSFRESLNRAIVEQGKMLTITALHERYKEASKPLLTKEEIETIASKAEISKELRYTEEKLIEKLYTLGYIFPVEPVERKPLMAQERFVWQKHWLTYGVYAIVNHSITRKKRGFVTKEDLKEILFDGKPRYIDKNGVISKRNDGAKTREKIVYDDEGREVLYEILQNYGWAIANNRRFNEIIFPHAVKLDEPESGVMRRFKFEKAERYVMIFESLPDNFFFRFVALAEKHIKDPDLLWRSGVVLFDLMDGDIKSQEPKACAKVEMKRSRLKIAVTGERKHFLIQSITYILTILLEESDMALVRPKFFQIVEIEGKQVMVDMAVMEGLSNQNYLDKLKQKAKEQRVAIFNVNIEKNYGQLNQGDTVVNPQNIVHVQDKLHELADALEEEGQSELASEARELAESADGSKRWIEKAKGFWEKTVKLAKDATALDKAGNVIGDLSDLLGSF